MLSLASWTPLQAAAPQVIESIPANGATGVAVGTTVVFKFDQAMATAIPVMASMPGIFVGNIE
ncbi:MAG: Ig-like domain-containing protein, partial [Verrucomicrobiae bacterium]|nr:Ig-like domain-containing protein [Verrucomicrobiae bacterium]